MNNSVYCKTMENVRNRINFRLISSEEQAFNRKNQLIRYTIFNENLVGVHLAKQCMKLNKPIFIGQNVLDQSKYIMNDFHYNKMLPYFTKDNLDLLFTDTDSLCYHIKNKDPFKFMINNKDVFDLSNYDKDNRPFTIISRNFLTSHFRTFFDHFSFPRGPTSLSVEYNDGCIGKCGIHSL